MQQNDEPINYEKLLEAMTQAQIAHNHDIDIMVQTLHSHPLTISNVANHSVRAKESSCFEKQDSISAHTFELAQTLNIENHIDILACYPFPEIELDEYDPEPQLGNLILLPDSIMTPVSSPNFNLFPESTLDPVPIHCELNRQSFMINKLNLTNFILMKVPLTNW